MLLFGSICENVRGFLLSRPPIVLFTALLGGFAVVMLVLGHIVSLQDIRNPDEKDWNDFLAGFEKVQFCLVTNATSDVSGIEDSEALGDQPVKEVVADVHAKLHESLHGTASPEADDVVFVSIPFWVEVLPTQAFVSIPHNVSHVTTSMTGKQLGLEGVNRNTEFNVTMTLPYPWNSSLCSHSNLCKVVTIQTCMLLEAPAKLFPKKKPSDDLCRLMNSTGGVENSYRLVSKKKSLVRPRDIVCDNYPSLTVNHDNDPKLTIMLTMHDKSAINLHLIHTSFFLFIMIVTVLCYAMVRGKPHVTKTKGKHYNELVTQL